MTDTHDETPADDEAACDGGVHCEGVHYEVADEYLIDPLEFEKEFKRAHSPARPAPETKPRAAAAGEDDFWTAREMELRADTADKEWWPPCNQCGKEATHSNGPHDYCAECWESVPEHRRDMW